MSAALLDPVLVAGVAPRPPQQVAVDRLRAVYGRHRRAQVRMACGVGKTHVGIFTAAAVAARRVVVAVPSLSLVDQTLRAWMPFLGKGAQTVAVCSAEGLFPGSEAAVGPRVITTDPGRIGFLLERDAATLVVATYASLPRVAAAARDSVAVIDLLVLDEAHHLTGHLTPGQRDALDDTRFPAARRLAMTATPVIATQADTAGAEGFDPFTTPSAAAAAVSMDDETLFGPIAHLYSTRQAIEDGYLCDYEVMVVSRVDTPFNRERLPLAALAAAANGRGVARALSFHNWVADARAFASLLNVSHHDSVRFTADSITGSTSAPARRQILGRLAGPCGPGVVRVVTAAKCLREGVDVCAVDAVLFAAPRSNTVEIVQAVGRVLRIHPGKDRGTIILPLLMPPGGAADDDEQLTASQFAHIWKVLRALNAHDPRIAQTLTRARRPSTDGARRGRKSEAREIPDWLHMVGGVAADTILGRLVDGATAQWDVMFQTLTEVVDDLGSAHRVTSTHVHRGRRIGKWVVTQRHNHRRGVMDPARVERLERVPGWTWRTEGLREHRAVDRLDEFVAQSGTCRDAAAGESRYPERPGEPSLGRVLAQLRSAYRDGRLERGVEARVEQLPGWTWEPIAAADRAGVAALAAFVAWEGSAVVPAGHVEAGFALSDWLDRCGRAYLAKRLPPELHEEILAVCPVNAKGRIEFAWDANRLRVEASLIALRRYVAAGAAITDMPTGHQEHVDGLVINLYQWCARVRWLARRGDLEESLRVELERIPGWVWDLREARTRVGAPVTLPDGVAHGRGHTRAHFGCPCRECDDAARAAAAAFKRQQMSNLAAGWVTAEAGAVRVMALMAANPWAVPASVAAAGCLPRTLLGAVLEQSPSARVPPWIAERLEHLTVAQVRPWYREGTRGRAASRAHEPGDPARHQRNLQRLRGAGWKDPEIGAALGYRGSAAHVTRPDPSSAIVHAMTQLLQYLAPDTAVPAWIRDPAA